MTGDDLICICMTGLQDIDGGAPETNGDRPPGFQWLGTKLAPRHRSQESNGSNGPSNGRAPGNQGNQWLSPRKSMAGPHDINGWLGLVISMAGPQAATGNQWLGPRKSRPWNQEINGRGLGLRP